ncbi:MAG: 2-oxoglutarate dehydrogenase E1 component, partial [Deltaproteobacteria bacterium]|nr:2-oxoglutarate dehydrogenase E1 component [Deltaproteobacteria bacterium]
ESDSHQMKLREIIQLLKDTYCRSIGVEFMHIQDPAERRWLQDRMESTRNRINLSRSSRRRILEKLYQAALFEQFLHKKYVGQTRFSLEGADVIIPMMDVLFQTAAANGCKEIILGMAHRGRLNIQAHLLEKPYEEIFSEFESCYDPEQLIGAGDVKYHKGYLADLQTADAHILRVALVSNPSHLESVDPVVEGFTRARQELSANGDLRKVVPLLIHGDAAFAGQGIVAETLNLSQLRGYATGGTIHIVINNQIGYTTIPQDARSSRYATDIAKMLLVPIFHVHGEDPEAVVHIARLACTYRMTFQKDVVIDVICYRRYGHNEGDEPYFTQPLIYERIRNRIPLNRIYTQKLLEQAIVSKTELKDLEAQINQRLESAYQAIHGTQCPFPEIRLYEDWKDFDRKYSHDPVKTAMEKEKLLLYARELNTVPQNFSLHPTLKRILSKRRDSVEKAEGIDWATAETLAFASILDEGVPIRLSGQDVSRGTFSQRHSVLVDSKTGEHLVPLNNLNESQAHFSVYDSMLSEAAVVGFEYGYALAHPKALVMWEAQFGDFVNNAQAVIDLYIASGESKWQYPNGIVLLLPHGYEGLGPEHSSARLERFLQLCAEDNIQVCNPTTPAQYFHLIRRQVKRKFRKPLIVMTPKSLLRHPLAVSRLQELTSGGFKEILDDPVPLKSPGRVLLCSGKIYYELYQKREELNTFDTAILRIEQFYPFPGKQLKGAIRKYSKIRQWYWVQEEPENMGGWWFIRPVLESIIGKSVSYISRKPSPSPATGFPRIFKMEQTAIVTQAFETVAEKSL